MKPKSPKKTAAKKPKAASARRAQPALVQRAKPAPQRKAQPAAKTKAKAKPAAAKSSRRGESTAVVAERWNLRLYVAGQTPRSLTAFANLKRICEERLPGRYAIEVVDLIKHPHLAQGDQIVAIPTLVRKLPEPIKRIVGDLSNVERVIIGIDLIEAVSA